jgi:hypothetical protein
METTFNNGQFAFTGFQFSPTVPADIQTDDVSVEESSAPKVEFKSVEDAVENVGAKLVAPVMPEVPMVVPDQSGGVSSGASAAVGTFGGNFPTVNSNLFSLPLPPSGLKKSKRRQEREDEELVSRVRELVIEDVRAEVRAEVRAGLDGYLEEFRTVVRGVKVGNEVDDGLVVEGSHEVSESSKRRGKGRRKVQNEGECII